MKQFNLKSYIANPRKVMTRDGRSARIVCVDAKGEYPVVALVECGCDSEDIFSFTNDGKYFICEIDKLDLFFAPEKHEGWFNIYHCDDLGFYIRQNQPYKSKEEADEIAKANFRTFFATVKVEWEE